MSSRVQLALNVNDIEQAVAFYRKLFGAEPAKRRPGYANFAIADPPLKLVLLESPGQGGSLNHLGVEVPDAGTVGAEQARLARAGPASSRAALLRPPDASLPDDPGGGLRAAAFRAGHHGGQTLRGGGQEPVVDPGAAPLAGDDPGFPQHLQVVADGGLGEVERGGQVADAHLAALMGADQGEQPQPDRVAERLEHLREACGGG